MTKETESLQSNRRKFVKSGVLGMAGLGLVQNQGVRGSTTNRISLFNVLDYGAIGDGKTMNTAAFARAIAACADAGGGIVFVPPGVFITGPIYLQSNMSFHTSGGAIVKGSSKLEDYPVEDDGSWGQGSGESTRAGVLTGRDLKNIAVEGLGIIDGAAMAYHDPNTMHGRVNKQYTRQGEDYMHPRYGTQHGPIAHPERPGNVVRFFNCQNVQVRDVTIQNSPTWTVQFNRCENVNVTGVNINSHDSGRRVPNDDGMDIFKCRNVHISDCDIQTGDDCIAIFGGEALTVTNCTLSSRSSGIRVGYIGGDIRNCTYQNLVINSNRGISLFVRGADSIENISFSNIIIRSQLVTGHWWGQAEPIHVSAIHWDPNADTLGTITNVRFTNIVAESDSGIVVHGSENSLIKDLLFENIRLTMKDSSLQPSYGGNFDLRAAKDASQALFAHDIPAMYCRFVDGLRIKALQVLWDKKLPDFFNYALQFEDLKNVSIEEFEGRQPHEKGSTIDLKRVDDIAIKNSRAAEGTDIFLHHEEVTNAKLFANNDATAAETAIKPDNADFTMVGNLL